MGWFSKLAPVIGGVAGSFIPGVGTALGTALGGALGGLAGGGGAEQSGTQTTTTQQQLDPRIGKMLFGENGDNGLLNQFQGFMNNPQSSGSQALGQLSSNWLTGAAPDLVGHVGAAGKSLIDNPLAAPQLPAPQLSGGAAQTHGHDVTAAQINAPAQNSLNLSGAFDRFVNGNPAENPYLKQSLQAGIDQSNQAFKTNIGNLTDTLQRQILPGIRGGAIASGMYGGSRQGIAEGLAMSDFTKQATNAAEQLGLANTAATTGAYAGAFDRGQDRSLSATMGLSGQQYATAAQQAQLEQQARLASASNDMASQFANQNATMDYAKTNLGAKMSTDALNSSNLLAANQQNNAAKTAGAGTLSALLGQLQGFDQGSTDAGVTRAQKVASTLAPFIGANASSTTSNPLYTNPAANALGMAGGALGLYNSLSGGKSGNSGGTNWGSLADLFGSQSGSYVF
jgi:hypothetical protein